MKLTWQRWSILLVIVSIIIISSAQIIITDYSGKVLKQINVSSAGKGMLNVNAATLASGAYNYSLIVDGKLIDTKKMVLAK